MAVKLNQEAFDYAKKLISEGKVDKTSGWKDIEPSREVGDEFIQKNGMQEYGLWHLGINDEMSSQDKGHYEFPIGDFNSIVRSGLIAAEHRAGQYGHTDIEQAAKELLNLIDSKKECC